MGIVPLMRVTTHPRASASARSMRVQLSQASNGMEPSRVRAWVAGCLQVQQGRADMDGSLRVWLRVWFVCCAV
jgi:hypothetical protein